MFYIVNKPFGITSFDVVNHFKNELSLKKVGHGGTLDPNASGLMVLASNEDTKLINKYLEGNKEYIAWIKFGKQTDTYDSSGKTINISKTKITKQKLLIELRKFLGENIQTPPLYSSIKQNGKKLYEYARNNENIEVKSRKVFINSIKIIYYKNNDLIVRINVSKGFYVRSFANDLGIKLNSYGYLNGLLRTKSSNFDIKDSISMNDTFLFKNNIYKNLFDLDENKQVDNLIIGHFDLIHKGHLNLLKNINNFSILTFINNPSKTNNFYNNDNRLENLRQLSKNIYYLDILKNNMDYLDFINLIKSKLNPSNIIVGTDFQFGKNKQGNLNHLKQHFNVIEIDKNNISTSNIKQLIKEGKIKQASDLLYNPLYFKNIVCHGKKIGRTIGYPTANIFYESNIHLKEGSYKSKTIFKNETYNSISFIRKIKKNLYIIETNIFNFDKNLYGKEIKVILDKFIREPYKIKNIDELKLLIQKDIENLN